MRIGMAAYCALLGGGGVYYNIKNLLTAMVRMDETLECILWYGYFRGRNLTPTDFGLPRVSYRVKRFPKKLLSRMWAAFGYPGVERLVGEVDVFHGMHFELPPAKRAKLVLTINDVISLKRPEYNYDPKTARYNMHFLLPQSIRLADRIIAISRCTRDDIIEFFPHAEEKITVVHFGRGGAIRKIDDQALQDKYLKMYGIKKPFILYSIGSTCMRKNLERTLDAFAILRERTAPDAVLALSGAGAYPLDLLRQIERLHLTEHVKTFQYDSEEALCALLSAAEFAIYPSLYEGFGLPILEAMSCGLPLITSNLSSMPEVAGDAALLINPEDIEDFADAMVRLWESAELRADLSKRGLEQARKFSWDKAARETLAVYKELMDEK